MTDTGPAAPAVIAQPRDRLIHIADIHFWQIVWNPLHMLNKRFWGNLTVLTRRRRDFVLQRAEPYADAVAATGATSLVLTGDFCSTSTPAEFEMAVKFVRGLCDRGLSVNIVPGNHDVYTFGAHRAKRFERHLGEFLPAQGYPALLTLPGGTPLILVPTVRPRHWSARGYISPEHVEQVGDLLKQAGDFAVLAGHYPVLHHTHGYISNPFRRLENAELLRTVLAQSGKRILYLGGHVHKFSHQRDAQCDRITYVTTGAFFRTESGAGTQGEFTDIVIEDSQFQVIRHVFRQNWEQLASRPHV